MVGNLLNIFMEHDLNILMIFGIKEKYNSDPYNILLAIATDIAVLLMTASVLQGHISADSSELRVYISHL